MTSTPSVMPIRASSFGGLFDCALRWSKVHLEKIPTWTSPRALIGTGVHGGAAAFDQARLDGHPIRLDDAAGVVVDTIAERLAKEPVRWDSEEPNQREVESIALRLASTYCAEISPRYEFVAVEQTVTPLDIDCGSGVIVRLTGTLDRSRTIALPTLSGTKRRIADIKTGRAAVNAAGVAATKKHKAQLGTYILLEEHTSGEPVDDVAEVIGLNTAGRFHTGTATTTGAKELLIGSNDDPGLIELAAQMFRTGLFPPNPQSALCSAKYCPHFHRCPYGRD